MTLFSTVSADAPVYVVEILMVGGAISGYWATGNDIIEPIPASIIIIEITQANIGRLIKNLPIFNYF